MAYKNLELAHRSNRRSIVSVIVAENPRHALWLRREHGYIEQKVEHKKKPSENKSVMNKKKK